MSAKDLGVLIGRVVWFALVGVVLAACSSDAAEVDGSASATASSSTTLTPSLDAGVGLPVSVPEEQGMDSEVLAALVDRVVSEGGIDSVTVVRNGHVVLDVAVYPFPPDRLHSLNSGTKSVIGTLIGIAIDEGLLAGVDVPVIDLLPDAFPDDADEVKASMTVEDLLTLQSGLDCRDEHDLSGLLDWHSGQRWAANVLAYPMIAEPGTQYEYCSGESYLLSAVLTAVTGRPASEYAEEVLFGPLGITDYVWPISPEGVTVGYATLELAPIDMAKIGQLYLQGGEWNGQQVVSRSWVETATSRHATHDLGFYGYQWWIDVADWVAARGWAGQWIYVLDELDTVVVFTAGLEPGRASRLPHRLILDYVLDAAKPEALPPNPDAHERLEQIVAATQRGPDPIQVVMPPIAERISGVEYLFDPNQYGHRWFRLDFDDRTATLTFHQEPPNPLPDSVTAILGYRDFDQPVHGDISLDGRFATNTIHGVTEAWRGTWINESTFHLETQSIGRHADLRATLLFRFEGDNVEFTRILTTDGVTEESTAHPGS